MYNENNKIRFITEFSTNISRRHIASVMFETLEPYEQAWGADICTRTKDELRPVVGEIIGFREKSKKTRLSILKEYIRWCMKNDIEGARGDLFEIEDFGLEKLKRQMVANPQHLQRYLNCVCDKESENTVDCIHRCRYWLAYGGMNDELDALEVRADEVDFTNMVVRHNDVEYPIYREAIPAFKNCVELREFRTKNPNYSKIIIKNRAEGNLLLRGINETKSYKAMRVEMSKRAKQPKYMSPADMNDESLNLKLSFYRVWLSGLFYRMYEAERAGMEADFSAAAWQFMEGKTYKLDSGRNTISAKQRQLARDYLIDYNHWKEAFSI